MPYYKHPSKLTQHLGSAFDVVHHLGQTVPFSGIYICRGCGHEIAANKGDPFPPQNKHQHVNRAIPVTWQLVVATK